MSYGWNRSKPSQSVYSNQRGWGNPKQDYQRVNIIQIPGTSMQKEYVEFCHSALLLKTGKQLKAKSLTRWCKVSQEWITGTSSHRLYTTEQRYPMLIGVPLNRDRLLTALAYTTSYPGEKSASRDNGVAAEQCGLTTVKREFNWKDWTQLLNIQDQRDLKCSWK